MSEPEDLWGDLPLDTQLRPPIVILREQASLLTKKTNGLLMGEVVPHQQGGVSLQSSLDIIATALNSYRFRLLTIQHGIAFYPVQITNTADATSSEAADEGAFIAAVRGIFSSRRTRVVLEALIAQSKASGPTPPTE